MSVLSVARRKRLYTGTLGAVANTVVYTAPTAPTDGSAAATFIFTACNKTNGAITVNMGVDNGSTLQGYLYNAYSIPANDTLVHGIDIDLMGGERIQAWASSGVSIDLNITGIEVKDS